MTRRDVRLTGLAVFWVVWAAGAEMVSISAGVVENHVLDLAVGAAYFVAGLIAMRRFPGNRLGPLMVAVAFLWFVGNFGNTDLSIAPSIGFAFGGISLPLVVWLFFAYPSGRLQTKTERMCVSAFVTWQVAFGIVIALTFDPRATCSACLHGALALFPSTEAVARMQDIDSWLGVGLPVLGGILLVLKHRRASPVERRALVPLWIGGAFLAAAFAIDGFVASGPEQGGAAYTLFQLENLARMAVPLCFLWGLLRSSLDRGGVTDLIERLSGPIPTGGLRDAMADVLHDPGLRLSFPLADGWVDEAGARAPGPELDGLGSSRIERDGRTLALIRHDPAIDERLIDAVGAATAMALENARLHAEVRARLEEVRASRARIVDAADAERRRIERDLHDGAQQRLLTLSFRLRAAMRRAGDADPALRDDLAEADDELRGAIEELRNLARGIHPATLTAEGLGPALASLAERAPMPVRITAMPGRRLPSVIEAAAYFVVAEALTNAARHAGTPVEVKADLRDSRLVVRVSDDGPGGVDERRGSGLRGLADRVEAVDGRLRIDSTLGGGTTVIAEFPCG